MKSLKEMKMAELAKLGLSDADIDDLITAVINFSLSTEGKKMKEEYHEVYSVVHLGIAYKAGHSAGYMASLEENGNMTESEFQIINAYRNTELNLQRAVRQLLGIERS